MKQIIIALSLAFGAFPSVSLAASLTASITGPVNNACADVTGDQILGSDLERAFPALHGIPPDIRIAPAPAPGGMRVFSEPELVSLGARFNLRVGVVASTVCFRVPTAPLNREAVMAAMRRSLPAPDTRIELADLSPEPVPPGVIQFPVEELIRPALPDAPALWRGEVLAGSRRVTVWAKARISAPVTRLVAVEDLKPGQPIQAGQIRAELTDGFPAPKVTSLSIASATGMVPLRSIVAGTEVHPENLVRPLDVARGDLVHVEVRMGKARLSLRGRAEAAGRVGDTIAVRNPESNSVFHARVEGKDMVLVDPQRSGSE